MSQEHFTIVCLLVALVTYIGLDVYSATTRGRRMLEMKRREAEENKRMLDAFQPIVKEVDETDAKLCGHKIADKAPSPDEIMSRAMGRRKTPNGG